MTRQDSIKIQTRAIMDSNGGQAQFNFKRSAKILGCHPNLMPRLLDDHGILVKRCGNQKMVSAVELANIIYAKLESPIVNNKKSSLRMVYNHARKK